VAESKVSLRGLKCPLPALKTRKLLTKLSTGDVLEIECTDPLTTIDIPNLLRETGDQLAESARKGRAFVFRIRKS
jgi:tRNA 2-thiouridine synthesizing protein A